MFTDCEIVNGMFKEEKMKLIAMTKRNDMLFVSMFLYQVGLLSSYVITFDKYIINENKGV